MKNFPTIRNSHPPINSSKSKKVWKLFKIRDVDKSGNILCSLCELSDFVDDDPDYKMTIGHINYPSPEFKNIYNSNDEVNLTPQHLRCNHLLQGQGYYTKHSTKLLSTLKKNIAFSKSKYKANLEFSRDNSVAEDSSSVQNKKSKIYDAKIQQYLSTFLTSLTIKIEFDVAKNDISGICEQIYGFGNEVSIKRHLLKICNRFNLKYVIEPNEDAIEIIRLMRPDEKELLEKSLNLFKNDTSMKSFI